MAARHFPVRPNFEQLKHQAKDLLRGIRPRDSTAIADLEEHHPDRVNPARVKLAGV